MIALRHLPTLLNVDVNVDVRVGGGVGDYLKYSPVAAKILLLSLENVWKY